MDMPDTDRLGDFAKKKVAESDARMKKVNPKGRKLDKNGNPIVTKEELKKSGMNLRDFLNKERGLTRRKDAPATAAPKAAPKKAMTAPMQGPAVKANPMGDAARDEAVMNDETRKRVSAPFTKRELEESRPMPNTRPVRKSPDMELMPYRRPAEEGYTFKRGGGVRGAGIAKRGLGRGRMC